MKYVFVEQLLSYLENLHKDKTNVGIIQVSNSDEIKQIFQEADKKYLIKHRDSILINTSTSVRFVVINNRSDLFEKVYGGQYNFIGFSEKLDVYFKSGMLSRIRRWPSTVFEYTDSILKIYSDQDTNFIAEQLNYRRKKDLFT